MSELSRRDAFKSLAALAAMTGMSVTPVTTQDAQGVELVLLKLKKPMSMAGESRLHVYFQRAVEGTPLEGVKVLVYREDELDVEFVRTRSQS